MRTVHPRHIWETFALHASNFTMGGIGFDHTKTPPSNFTIYTFALQYATTVAISRVPL